MDNLETLNYDETSEAYGRTLVVTGLIFGIAAFCIKILLTYWRLQSHPKGAYFSADLIAGTILLVWLIKACGGFFASWYYNKKSGTSVLMGRAAMIGFLTGAAITIVGIFLNQIWQWIDPALIHHRLQSDIAIIKAVDLPADQKKKLIDSVTQSLKGFRNPGLMLFSGIFTYGIPNLITGMIGAKLFKGKNHNERDNYASRESSS
jgi:uncharacterized protein YqgC (DUF456 family)